MCFSWTARQESRPAPGAPSAPSGCDAGIREGRFVWVRAGDKSGMDLDVAMSPEPPPPRPRRPRPRRKTRRATWHEWLLEAYRLTRALGRARDLVSLPLARAAEAFVRLEGWRPFGYARLADHARERFGRSGRGARDLACLGRGLGSLPSLADALRGGAEGRPIGRVAALLISKVASPGSAGAWVALARRMTVRELR